MSVIEAYVPAFCRTVSSAWPAASQRDGDFPACLTMRQREILWMLGQGHTRPQIARRLHISGKTVDTHCDNIRQRLGLENCVQLAAFAGQWVGTELAGVS